MDLNAANVNEYNWIIPNEPTNNLQLRLVGQDAVGLSDTSEVGGITIEISYPMVTNVSPASGSIDFRTNEFYFNFSQGLDVSTVTSDNVQFEIELITPIAMEKELRFAIREGGHTVGAGVVTEILS